ncbi:DNA-binding protein [Actinoplanes sp. SE50]|uniref:helix-turn-helix domain-containing protein n=1 Tax=unclassified Actinoplanes TaxID=2626549 RepID=UPI00023EBB5C|nr:MULTISPECIES: helix-turn-helix transcriptional regulator [unclassified Actinoplanes]AEV83428.1 DNA-binding protein [Actinoplanes sp. SE50/110]ATO81821.1 DNA-binding protein [Actinoplanes sp. SE50]SLL99229.1 transcriptional regulator [Actinoplanes sp. SE50/110]
MGVGERRAAALERKRLTRRLYRIRLERGLTQAQVAERMRWSQSKVHRIETGENSISYADLKVLLGVYEVDDQLAEELTAMADAARQRSLPEMSDIHSKDFRDFLESELIADREYEFENSFVPGLLQTREYAETVVRKLLYADSCAESEREAVLEQVRRIVSLREMRQQVFAEGGISQARFVLDEAVLRRVVGGGAVMRQQLEHLRKMSRHPRVDLRVLPFSTGAHVAMAGPFVILEFPDAEDRPLLYLENAAGEFLTKHDERLLARFAANFEELRAAAHGADRLDALLDGALAALG